MKIRVFAALLIILGATQAHTAATPQKSTLQQVGDALERAAVARASARSADEFDPTFRKYSKRYFGPGWDWRLFKAQAMAESSLQPDAESSVGARGLMQLMPSTYQEIQSQRPEFGSIDDPEWNIAAGILQDRHLWRVWSRDVAEGERSSFMFGSYNAGQGTITRAAETAEREKLDHARWPSIEIVAPKVPRWRYQETLTYVRRIQAYYDRLHATR